MAEIELKKRAVYAGDVHIALLKAGWSIREACDFVNGLPKADVAPVVHCKDCVWRDEDDDCTNPKCGKSWYGCHVPDEHYCSYGERRCEDERN